MQTRPDAFKLGKAVPLLHDSTYYENHQYVFGEMKVAIITPILKQRSLDSETL